MSALTWSVSVDQGAVVVIVGLIGVHSRGLLSALFVLMSRAWSALRHEDRPASRDGADGSCSVSR